VAQVIHMGRSDRTFGVVSKGVPYWSCFAGGIGRCQWIHGNKDALVFGASKPEFNHLHKVELQELLKRDPMDVALFDGCRPGANNPVWTSLKIRHMVWLHASSNRVFVPTG
jgi:hypothetical protein